MRSGTRRVGVAVTVLPLAVLVGGCAAAPTRPEATGKTRAVDVEAVVASDGLVQVSTDVRFAESDGVVALRAPVLATISEVRLDGNPRSITVSQYPVEVDVRRRETVIGYRLSGGVERHEDVAVVTVPVWSLPSDASGSDEPVPVSGALELPAAPVGDGVRLHGVLDPRVSTEANVVRFEGRAAWPRDAELVAVVPADTFPEVTVLPGGPRLDDVLDRERERTDQDAGFPEEIDDRRRREDLWAAGYWGLVGAEVAVPFLIAAPRVLRSSARRRRALEDVPNELMDAPGTHAPAVVSLLARDGHDIGREAVAATILQLVDRGALTLDGVTSDRYQLTVRPDASGEGPGEDALLTALRESMPTEGGLVGPPLDIDPKGAWWPALRRETLAAAKAEGLVERRYPSGAFLTAVGLLTATTLPLWARSPEAAVGGLVAAGILCMLPFVGGYVLTATGHRMKALWEAFARRAVAASEIKTAPPRAVTIWGHYLVYGAAFGVAPAAVAALTPEGKT